LFTFKKETSERLADPAKRNLLRGRIKTERVLRLPWVIDEPTFVTGCTQCTHCINACETNIIIKDEDGFPKVDFSLGECTFCNKCIESCEQPLFSGSFTHDSSKEITQITEPPPWPATLHVSDKCLAKNNVYCQSCRDECETSVIKFNYLNSSIPQPSLNELDCTQCGACIKSCPQVAIAFNFDQTTV
jgi:ferredoxin-type protein NapF